MNRNQRKYGRSIEKTENKAIDPLIKNNNVEELSENDYGKSKFRRKSPKSEKFQNNRCCHVRPVHQDESIITDSPIEYDPYKKIVWTQNDRSPDISVQMESESIQNDLDLKTYEEKSSQYLDPSGNPILPFIETAGGCHWRNVNNIEELDTYLIGKEGVPHTQPLQLKNVHISQVPRIKTIAEKYSKFKKNNVELRKLEEKIVCIEYDVFTDEDLEEILPVQTMRAYFSVKPSDGTQKDTELLVLPSSIKRKFNLTDEDLDTLNEKEIEMIDAKLAENRPYLDDLKRVLKRKRAIYAKKRKSTLDLKSLYEMAKREFPSLDDDFSDTNLLSKAELEEIKHLILKKCVSSVHGISRRTVKTEKERDVKREGNTNVISESIFAELIRI